MNWFFDQFVKGTQTLDYEIAHVTTEPVAIKAGIYESDEQKSEVKVEETEAKGGEFETEVSLRRLGEAYFPIEMSFRFEDGTHIMVTPIGLHNDLIEYKLKDTHGREWADSWSIKDRWKKFKFTTGSRLREAELDPGRKVLLDANITNNSWTTGSGIRAATRWSSGSMFWFQALLQFVGGLT
jgi:hypothetical protein